MKISVTACLIICLSASALFAQQGFLGPPALEDPTKSKWSEEKIEHPPAREIKFETSDEPQESRLSRPDPKLLEQKVVAVVRLTLPAARPGGARNAYFRNTGEGSVLDILGQDRFFEPAGQRGRPLQDEVERVVKMMPEKLRPEAAKVDFLNPDRGLVTTWGQVNRGFGSSSSSSFGGLSGERERQPQNYREFHILAPSQEVAEERVKTLLLLLDQGMARPIQAYTWKYRAVELETYLAAKKRQSELTGAIDTLVKQAAEYADFNHDMLPGLRLQQTQLDINLADVKARLATCDKLLEKGGTRETMQKLEETKIACAIELAGLEAGRGKSDELLKKVKTKIELVGKRNDLDNQLSTLNKKIDRHERTLAAVEQELDDFSPRPIADGKAIIKPLVWTQ